MVPRKIGKIDVMNELPALRRYALSLTRHPVDAEDLVHDALVRAMERSATYNPAGNLRGWLLSIVHNLHIDRLRSGKSAAARDRDFAAQSPDMLAPTQMDSVRLSQVRQAFDRLPDEQREAMHLVAIEGLSYEEAAAILGVPAGTVMSRISRGRETLRRWESAPPLRLIRKGQ
ncbi:MAG: sigma-70 family RNA polymerase sigma factor [Devosia sp.]|uniref:sigma-70 family RNA polymerase sigma factor n=1 Tax=Devosia sp. TaxID=1871048 RepID=UPI0024CC4B30|nr:sigma-70 family RNA polymerase sigma factor [Devosia sp.]UYN98589.1 MAG: sigma-70 family RNA polymerase sigma factor [Devosia sp.]